MRGLLAILWAGAMWAQAPPANLAAKIAAHPPRPELAPNQAMGEDVMYAEGLHGFLYKPAGDGPFPVMIWNHGSEAKPGWQPELAAFYNRNGFVFFMPHRRGHGRSPGEYIVDINNKIRANTADRATAEKEMVRLHDVYANDVEAAVRWIQKQPFVDQRRIVMSGCSYGGIQTLIASQRDLGVRAYVPFAPAAMSWAMVELRERLLTAVRQSKAPIFLLQAHNDYSLGPSEVLGPEIRKRNRLNRSKIYPSFGPEDNHQLGHAGFACWNIGTEVWGADVLSFLKEVMR